MPEDLTPEEEDEIDAMAYANEDPSLKYWIAADEAWLKAKKRGKTHRVHPLVHHGNIWILHQLCMADGSGGFDSVAHSQQRQPQRPRHGDDAEL